MSWEPGGGYTNTFVLYAFHNLVPHKCRQLLCVCVLSARMVGMYFHQVLLVCVVLTAVFAYAEIVRYDG